MIIFLFFHDTIDIINKSSYDFLYIYYRSNGYEYYFCKKGEEIIRNYKDFFKKLTLKRSNIYILIALLIVSTISIALIKLKTITIIIDEYEDKVFTYKNTVEEVLKSKKIMLGAKDKVYPDLSSNIPKNASITIKRAVNINLIIAEKEQTIESSEDTVDLMLKAENITLNTEDKIKPDKDTKIYKDMKVEIIRVETKSFTDILPIDFKTSVKTNSSLPNTQKNILQEGKTGEKKIITNVTYENGKEVARSIMNEVVVKEPRDKVIVQGTYPVMPISRGGDPVPYSKVFKAKATAYYAVSGVGKTYTASGRKAVRDINGYSTIAVDPNVIPYGSRLFVEGYGFAVAADTGTGIVGNTIDVFFDTYKEACDWAVKYVNVYILK